MSSLAGPPAVNRRSRLPGGLSLSGALSLVAVSSVLLFVSVPRLHGIALQENAVDAKATALQLARALAASEAVGPGSPKLADLCASQALRRALSDAELLSDGRQLRRHGYLFELVTLPPPVVMAGWPTPWPEPAVFPQAGGRLGVLAWPWRRGRTGEEALLATETGLLYGHPNQPPAWDGEGETHALTTWAGWRELR